MPARNAEYSEIELSTRVTGAPPDGWDDFVRATPGGTFCHLSAWGRIMTEVLGHECLYATVPDEAGRLIGVLPLVEVRSRLFGHHLVSMPFLNYGGPIGSSEARMALTAWAGGEAERRGADLVELRWRQEALAPRDDAAGHLTSDFRENARKITVVLPLPGEVDTLWEEGLKSKVRSQVRRPMKEGYEARIGHDQLGPFYDVFSRNMRDLGTPVLPRALFEALPGAFGDDVVFAVIYDGDRPIAGGCGFQFEGEFELTWASSLREFNRTAPNMLLYWRLMEHAITRGGHAFNFGRCTPGGGTHRFKSQWGGEDEPLPWAVWSGEGETATPNPDQAKYRLATRLWSRLPVPLTRVLGPPLARRIP